MRLSSFEVSTTKGILLALMVPSFGMLNCHTSAIPATGLKRVVYLVQFVDQQDTRLLELQRAQKRASTEKLLAV